MVAIVSGMSITYCHMVFYLPFSGDSLLGNEVNDAARVISHSVCQQIAEMSEAASGAASDENQN